LLVNHPDLHSHHDEAQSQLNPRTFKPRNVRLAIVATAHCLFGCGLGEIVGMIIGMQLGLSNTGTIVVRSYLASSLAWVLVCDRYCEQTFRLSRR
jgi:hypothetical protein